MAAAAILEIEKSPYLGRGLTVFDEFDTVMQFRPCADANWDSSDEWKVKLKREVELFQYGGGPLFHAAGIGFVRYYISLAFSRKTANINAKKTVVL